MMRVLALLLVFMLVAGASPFDPYGLARIEARPGAQVPLGTPLRDQSDAATTLAKLARGRPIVLVPVLHDCPNFCGVTLDALVEAVPPGERGRVAIIALGIDPAETPAQAGAALGRLFGRQPAMAGAIDATVGTAAADHAITDALGYRYAYDRRIGQYAHAAASAVLTPDGRLVGWIYGLAPDRFALASLLAEARSGRTPGFVERLVLLCYHYDPVTARYGLAVDWLLRVGCALTVLAVLGYVALARRREGAAQ